MIYDPSQFFKIYSFAFLLQVMIQLRILNFDEQQSVIRHEERKITRKQILKHSEMCIDYNFGNKLIDKQNVSHLALRMILHSST